MPGLHGTGTARLQTKAGGNGEGASSPGCGKQGTWSGRSQERQLPATPSRSSRSCADHERIRAACDSGHPLGSLQPPSYRTTSSSGACHWATGWASRCRSSAAANRLKSEIGRPVNRNRPSTYRTSQLRWPTRRAKRSCWLCGWCRQQLLWTCSISLRTLASPIPAWQFRRRERPQS